MAGVYSSRNIRNRRDLNRSGLYILFANTAAIGAVDLMMGISVVQIGADLSWGAANALASVVVATGLLHLMGPHVFTIRLFTMVTGK